MNVTEAVRQRISTRGFLDTPIPRDQLAELLETAQRSPSGGNLQPWKVIAVTGAAKDEVIGIAHRVLAADPMGVVPGDRPVYPDLNAIDPVYNERRKRVGEMMYAKIGIPKEDRAGRIQRYQAKDPVDADFIGRTSEVDRHHLAAIERRIFGIECGQGGAIPALHFDRVAKGGMPDGVRRDERDHRGIRTGADGADKGQRTHWRAGEPADHGRQFGAVLKSERRSHCVTGSSCCSSLCTGTLQVNSHSRRNSLGGMSLRV